MSRLAHRLIAASTLAAALTSHPARAQDSGVLLGLHVSIPDSGESYRTYWITHRGGAVRVEAAGPDLLVPRRSGFWRVCVVTRHELSDAQLNEWDTVVARPATSRRGLCAARGRPVTEAEQQDARCHISTSTQILFVGVDALSREQDFEGDCGAHPAGSTDVLLTSLDSAGPIKYSALLDSARLLDLLPATLKAAREEFADFGTVDTTDVAPDDTVPSARLEVMRQWAIERGPGKWQTVGQASCSPYVACGDDTRRFSMPLFPAPASLVGHDALSPSLESIKNSVPAVTDAVSSPRRDMVVALTDEMMLVFAVHDGRLGAPLVRVPIYGKIVMAQWAVGRFVPAWSGKVKTLLETRR